MNKKEVETQIEKLTTKIDDAKHKILTINASYEEKVENYKNKMFEEKTSKVVPIEENISLMQNELAKYEKALKIFEKQEADLAKIFDEGLE